MKNHIQSSLQVIFALVLLLMLGACASAPVESKQETKGLLWKIQSKSLSSESYLFGTMHSEDPRIAKIDGPVKQAFDQSPHFVLEVELDKVSTQAVLGQMYYTSGERLEHVLGKSLYKQALAAMEKRGMPEKMVSIMKPWAVFMILNMPEAETGEFLDALMYKTAKASGKKVTGLETLQEQVDVFDQMKMATQKELLRSTLEHQNDMDKIMDETIETYLTRDLDNILALNDKYLKLLSPEVGNIFTQRLLLDRNKRMTKRMLPLLKQGKTFIAVGALHLPGKEGIINLLAEQGYQLTPIH